MTDAIKTVEAFGAGCLVEMIYAQGVILIEQRRSLAAGVLSCAWAAAFLAGLDAAWGHGVPAVAWMLGYGVGTWFVVEMQRHEEAKKKGGQS